MEYIPLIGPSLTGASLTAESIDIWIVLCDKCSFAKEPVGFEKPAGADDRMRHRVIGPLNPGVSFEKITLSVKSASTDGFFQMGFHYSCKTCGGKILPDQIATIYEAPAP